MTWKKQIEYLMKICKPRINFMRCISGTWWGAHPTDLINLYKTTILSVLEYGCFTFSAATNTHFFKLEKIQNRCIRISLGLMKSTHTKSIEVLSSILPLKLRFHELNTKFLVRCLTTSHPLIDVLDSLFNINPSNRILKSYIHCITQDIEKSPSIYSNSFDIEVHCLEIKVDTSLVVELNKIPPHQYRKLVRTLLNNITRNVDENCLFYTDGSIINGKAGFGVYNSQITYYFNLKSPCSIFIAELTSLYFACLKIKDLIPQTYYVCSDSLSTILSLNNFVKNNSHHLIWLIRNLLFELNNKGFIIKFIWVPAHCGIFGNEQADALAKLGASRGILYDRGINFREYFPLIRQQTLDDWQLSWDSSDLGRWCHSILPRVRKKNWFHHMNFNRSFIVLVSRLISNHYSLNSHLFRINIVDSNLCECSEGYEDIDHVILHCSRFTHNRNILFSKLLSINRSCDFSVRDALGSKDFVLIKLLIDFLNKSSIRI